jgi:Zn-finger nucleic acid-binding protein
MNCPKCDVKLEMSNKQGIEIYYCPNCRGEWHERGELDKIIKRSTESQSYQNYNPHNNMFKIHNY